MVEKSSQVFQLWNKLASFLQDQKPNWSQLFQNILAYLVIFPIFNNLNTSMQGRVALDFAKANKIDWQTQTLEAWKSQMSRDYYMFHQLVTVTADADEDLNVVCLWNVIKEWFGRSFSALSAEDPWKRTGWIWNPFMPLKDDFVLSVTMKDKAGCWWRNEDKFENFNITYFLLDKHECPDLNTLLPFLSNDLHETGFSTMSIIKTKYRNCIGIHSPLWLPLFLSHDLIRWVPITFWF